MWHVKLSLMLEKAMEQASSFLIFKGIFHPPVYYNFSMAVTMEN